MSRGYDLAVTDMPDTHRRKEALEETLLSCRVAPRDRRGHRRCHALFLVALRVKCPRGHQDEQYIMYPLVICDKRV